MGRSRSPGPVNDWKSRDIAPYRGSIAIFYAVSLALRSGVWGTFGAAYSVCRLQVLSSRSHA